MNALQLVTLPFKLAAAWVDARPGGGAIRETLDQVKAVQVGETVEIRTHHGSPMGVVEGASHAPSVQAGLLYARQLTRTQCGQVKRRVKVERLALKRIAEYAGAEAEASEGAGA